MIRRFAAMLACAAFLSVAPPAAAQSRLSATPQPGAAEDLPFGVSALDKASFVYRPTAARGAKPGVLVLFHGAGGDARRFLELFRDEAERRNLILVSMQSLGRTWDIMSSDEILSAGRARSARSSGRDAKRADAALAALFRRVAVDSDRIVAAGFSDGASYALSLALGNDQLIRGVVGLAPGFIKYPGPRGPLRIAITHGTEDPVLSFDNARQIASELRKRGHRVTVLPFEGGHTIEQDSLAKALDFALRAGGD